MKRKTYYILSFIIVTNFAIWIFDGKFTPRFKILLSTLTTIPVIAIKFYNWDVKRLNETVVYTLHGTKDKVFDTCNDLRKKEIRIETTSDVCTAFPRKHQEKTFRSICKKHNIRIEKVI